MAALWFAIQLFAFAGLVFWGMTWAAKIGTKTSDNKPKQHG